MKKNIERQEASYELNDSLASLSNEENICPALPLQIARYQQYKSGNHKPKNAVIRKKLTNVNQKALSMAVNTLVSRHESLRIFFLDREGKVLQNIFSPDNFTSNLSLLNICEQDNKEEKLKLIIDNAHKYLFDFQKEQSFKFKLIKYEKNTSLFIFIIDHIIYDGHSLKIIEQELFLLYDSFNKGLPNPLKPLKFQLRDYIRNYYSHYRGDKLAYHQLYYKNLFKNLPQKLRINRNNSYINKKFTNSHFKELDNFKTKSHKGGRYRFVISNEVLNQIQNLTSELNISFFSFMLASYAVFLSSISNFNDFFIDSPMSARDKKDYSKIIGWFTGALVTRIKVNYDTDFRDFLLSCTSNIIEAFDHIYYQNFPEDLGIEWFRLATQLNVLNDINSTKGRNIVNFEPHHFDEEYALFDIYFIIEVFENGIIANCIYRNDVIDKSEISEICKNFDSVLKMAISSPIIKIKDWDLFEGNIST